MELMVLSESLPTKFDRTVRGISGQSKCSAFNESNGFIVSDPFLTVPDATSTMASSNRLPFFLGPFGVESRPKESNFKARQPFPIPLMSAAVVSSSKLIS
jgi:hypothetical protein